MANLLLGLGGSTHEFSSVIMDGNNILCGIEEERVTRRKHGLKWWFEIPCEASLNYCLKHINKTKEDIQSVITSDLMPSRVRKLFPDIITYDHHLLHAASIYYFTEHDDMGIVVMDGWGSKIRDIDENNRERETISFYRCNNNEIKLIGRTIGIQPIEKNSFPMGISNSLGFFYALLTYLAGFGNLEEGKTMGLAGYGKPIYFDLMMQYIKLGKTFEDCFCYDPFEENFIKELKGIVVEKGYDFQTTADIAASGQLVLETAIMNIVSLMEKEGFKHIGFAGGCALNSVANGKVDDYLNHKGKELIVFPHVHDAGIAFGAVSYHYFREQPHKKPILINNHDCKNKIHNISRCYPASEIIEAINAFYPYLEYEVSNNPESKIAKLLLEGEIVALFTGSSEFGPRALGNRSLLSNPTSAKFREKINREVKFREPFRPIAPVVLDKYYSDFFEGRLDKPFMLQVAKVKESKIDLISSVVHIDNTARVQTLYEGQNPLLYRIIEEFYSLLGIPIISNTSFNLKGEPIVETPKDALKTFLRMEINYMYLQGFMIKKAKQ